MTSTSRSIRPPFVACFLYALRVCVPPRRWALLALPITAAGLFGLLARAAHEPTAGARLALVAGPALCGLVLPFVCLVVGDAVLASEVRSGGFSLTWLSPTPLSTIVLARWAAGWTIAAVALAPAMVLAALAAGAPEAAGPAVVAAVAGAGAYIAVFVVIGAVARRSALWSLVVVLLVERLLGTALTGIAQLSPQWLATTAYGGLGPDARDLLRHGVPSGSSAVVRLALITAVALAIATRRLRRLPLAGSAD
jgi:ABC-2 type transport system permease protein